MNDIFLQKRADYYNNTFPDYPPLIATDKFIYGMWMLGQNYKGSGFYGAYPPSYIKRVMSMFPDVDAENILHLFSGSLTSDVKGDRFDINPELNPDIVGDAEHLSQYINKKYNLILADPPYTEEDASKYGYSMVGRHKVFKECEKVLKKGGFLIWLDQICPMWKKDILEMCITIGIIRSSNHRFRVVTGFKKV